MTRFFKLSRIPRLQMALAVACAGLLVSLVMVHWGGSMSRHLPENGFHFAAFVGAGLAGLLLADGLGHHGQRGWVLSALSFLGMTILGGPLGASLGMYVTLPFYGEMEGFKVSWFIGSLPHLWGLGWLALADGLTTSIAVASVWLLSIVPVHVAARLLRSRHMLRQSVEPF